ncbi:hypothetical protein HYX13_00025 [Candidatus Woesearchaeota archaeon]|nr:hypothetical protein [Candidatus Woesearchaeota archaeon]
MGILTLAAIGYLASGCLPKANTQRTEDIQTGRQCIIQSLEPVLETRALDTNQDGKFDEAFITNGYTNLNWPLYRFDDNVFAATTHLVAPGLPKERQFLTGFPKTELMTDDYQLALQIVCNEQ